MTARNHFDASIQSVRFHTRHSHSASHQSFTICGSIWWRNEVFTKSHTKGRAKSLTPQYISTKHRRWCIMLKMKWGLWQVAWNRFTSTSKISNATHGSVLAAQCSHSNVARFKYCVLPFSSFESPTVCDVLPPAKCYFMLENGNMCRRE